jgi:hydrogenase-4 component F
VVQGTPPAQTDANGFHDSIGTAGPILLFLALVLLLGLYIPPPVESLLRDAAAFLEEVKR